MTALKEWTGCKAPDMPETTGRLVEITPFDPAVATEDLFAIIGGPHNDDLWRYIPLGPFENAAALHGALVLRSQRSAGACTLSARQ